ncbi:MAG: calcium/sodium antiporter [Turicibacter sp.]
MDYIFLLLGFGCLVKGADWFVDGSSSIAKTLKIPSLIIGLTIVAFGTSAPEVAVSIIGAIKGSNDMAVGNVVGSNIFNLLGVVGVAAIISPLIVKKSIVAKEFPFALLATVSLLILGFDTIYHHYTQNILTRGDGVMLMLLMGIFVYYLIELALTSRSQVNEEPEEIKSYSLSKSIGFSVVGLVAIVVGGQLVVSSATTIALAWGMSESLVGLTIVGIGTSLPELVTSIIAAFKGESDIALGNVIGSNIFNIFFILGLSAVIKDIVINPAIFTDVLIMVGITIMGYIFAITHRRINRFEGFFLVGSYIAYMIFIIYRG